MQSTHDVIELVRRPVTIRASADTEYILRHIKQPVTEKMIVVRPKESKSIR